MNLEDKTVLITGGAHGIGRAMIHRDRWLGGTRRFRRRLFPDDDMMDWRPAADAEPDGGA